MAEENKDTIKEEIKTESAVKINSILGKKVGMTQLFDESGNVFPVTVIEAGPCVVAQVKTIDRDGYNAVQVGFGKAKEIKKPLKGHLQEINAKYLRELCVEHSQEFKVGQEIKVSIFKPGDVVSVSGVSIGKGFAGTVKRYHYARGPMSHGSKSHRIPGSIGAGTTPGRVFKGKGMPGRMGACNVTVENLQVVRVELEKNLIMVNGSVPGKPGNLVKIEKG